MAPTVSKTRRLYTDVLIINESTSQVLLGRKKRGAFTGLYNGFGGKVDPGETVAEGAQREVKEECGLHVSLDNLQLRAQVDIEMLTHIYEIYVYTCTLYEGEIVESYEMAPAWFDLTSIPYDQMWPDIQHWFPFFLPNTAGACPTTQVQWIQGVAIYGGDDEKDLKSVDIWEAKPNTDGALVKLNPDSPLVTLKF